MIDETTLYYTFSTISQTLGGAIALLGAFVLYKLQTIYSEMDNEIEKVYKFYNNGSNGAQMLYHHASKFNKLFFLKNYDEIINHFDDDSLFSTIKNIYGSETINPFEAGKIVLNKLWDLKKTLLRRLTLSLIMTIFTMIYSVGILSITPEICEQSRMYILLSGTGLFSFCVILYGFIIYKAIKN